MDKSVDSIGSCSLDAESTDFSDTSEGMNFISTSTTREGFTLGVIPERCRKVQQPLPSTPKLILNHPACESGSSNITNTSTTAFYDVDSGKYATVISKSKESNGVYERFISTKTFDLESPSAVANVNKKPSYLNLACCVNGYSNYTNYDSAERKEISKSREASPIPPIVNMSRQIRHEISTIPSLKTVKNSPLNTKFGDFNIYEKDTTDNAGFRSEEVNKKSFIQQRVEKLYGTTNNILTNNSVNNHLKSPPSNGDQKQTHNSQQIQDDDMKHSLPVMKHLRPEFYNRLQFVTPSKNSLNNLKSPDSSFTSPKAVVVVDEEPKVVEIKTLISSEKQVEISNNVPEIKSLSHDENSQLQHVEEKDGYYFLKLLEAEKMRILNLASEAEDELQKKQSEENVHLSEDIVGLVLAAVGKARLLATKKFKQFEGLCHENINPNSEGPQTLGEDLQGFWDMMMIQVENIDTSFKEINLCIENGWKRPELSDIEPPKGSRLTKRPTALASKSKQNNNLSKKSTSNTEAAQKREEQRKKLLEMKRKQKAAINNIQDDEISILN